MTDPIALNRAEAWEHALLLGYPPLDEVHSEFASLLATLAASADSEMVAALNAVALHTREHFGQEERWMQETCFPAAGCHAQEHAAVLVSMDGVARRLANGDFGAGRRLAQALTDWFPGHATHLDSALSHWMCKQIYGGKPVVLRRAVQSLPAAA